MKIMAIRKLTATDSRPEGMKLKDIREFFDARSIDFENEVYGNECGYGYFNEEKIVFFVNARFPDRAAFYMDADFNMYFRCEECQQFHKKSEVNFLAVNYLSEDIAGKRIVCYDCMDKYQKDIVYAEANNGISIWFKKNDSYLIDDVFVSRETRYNSSLVYKDNITGKLHLISKTPYMTAKTNANGILYFTEDYYRNHTDEFFVCSDCGEIHYLPRSRKYTLNDGSLICDICYSTKYCTTDNGEVILKSDSVEVEKLSTHGYSTTILYRKDDPDLANMKKCSHCGKYIAYDTEILGEHYCKKCQEDLAICGYHYAVIADENGKTRRVYLDEGNKALFYKPKKIDGEETVMFFGFEIETYQDRKNVVWIHDKYGDLFNCETDGSLDRTYGVEMISQPMSWNYLLANKERISQMFSALMSSGARGHDAGCGYGLHVHVSRDAFVNEEAECFANTLLNGFSSGVEIIARRRGTDYCNYTKSNDRVVKKNSYAKNTGHYCSLNFEHGETVEFRVFRSTLNINTLMATIEFVKNIVEMSNALAGEESKNKYAKFYHLKRVSFLDLLDGEYLPAYIEERKRNNAFIPTISIDFNGYFIKETMKDYIDKSVTIKVDEKEVSLVRFYFINRNAYNAMGINYTCKDLKEYCEKQGKEVFFFKKPEKTEVSPKSIERTKRKQEEKRKKRLHTVRIEELVRRMGVAC